MSSSTVSVSAATPTQHPFQRKIDDIKPSKSDINSVVMDYLISEGYPRAAQKFAKEANLQYPVEQDSIQARVEIRNAIHAGDIDTAINKVNDLNPQILDTDPALHFSLLRLQLIELIRTCLATPQADIMPAINFAQSQLAPRAATNEDFQKDLEHAMTLLILLPGEIDQPELADLLKPSLRREVASRVNEVLLCNMGRASESKLRNLVRTRLWAEQKARESGKDLPPELPLGLQDSLLTLEEPNGAGADVMVS